MIEILTAGAVIMLYGGHRALGDCLKTLEKIKEMAAG